MGEISVVGDHKEPFRIPVQPAHREEVFPHILLFDQVQDRFLPSVLGGADDAGRLMEHVVDIFFVGDLPAPEGNDIFLCHLPSGILFDLPVDQSKACPDPFFKFAPGPCPHIGQVPVQAKRLSPCGFSHVSPSMLPGPGAADAAPF